MVIDSLSGHRALRAVASILLLAVAIPLQAEDSDKGKVSVQPKLAESLPKVDYLTDIKPLLASRCFACHGALQKKAGLRLDTVELMRKGGDGGDILDREAPLLVDRLVSTDPEERMPPEGEAAPLSAEQIGKIRAWIEAGAPAPDSETPEANPRDHWAFRSVVRPEVPSVRDPAWVKTPIDAFILAKLETKNLKPAPAADPGIQLRRLYLDLVGLPPRQADLDLWKTPPSDSEYRLTVAKLLSDPAYGERWGRHWMDIWRYSDWWGLGDQLRNSQKNIWHWRDWIVESLNRDEPYDRMVRSMIAADEIDPENIKDLRATGYLARNYFLFNRNQWLDETVEHVGKAFLGLTVNCAKCHDHKYDPISQSDYYSMRAIFEPYMVRNDLAPGHSDMTAGGIPRAYDARPDDPTWLFVRGDDKNPDKSRPIVPGVPGFIARDSFAVQRVELPAHSRQPGLRPFVRQSLLDAAQNRLKAATDEATQAEKAWSLTQPAKSGEKPASATAAPPADLLGLMKRTLAEKNRIAAEEWNLSLRARMEADTASERKLPESQVQSASRVAAGAERRYALATAELEVARLEVEAASVDEKARPAVTMKLQAARTKRDEARKAVFEPDAKVVAHTPVQGAEHARTMFMSSTAFDADPSFPSYSTGRRKALADWMIDRNNPLTARVAVNHIWTRHFGEPLVATVFDFGRKGQQASHPELLDWLAVELMDSGWSMKHIHKLIVESNTYRLSSSVKGREENQRLDPDNHLLWHRAPIRVESQVVRDMILHLAGKLDMKMGGPPVQPADQERSNRRSVYFFHSNNDRNAFLTTFDEALVRDCYKRDKSIVPQQALALSNSKLVADSAGAIVSRFEQELASTGAKSATDQDFVRHAFLRILAFEPSPEETAACLETMRAWAGDPSAAQSAQKARSRLVWALINHNDFVTLR
jgi:hypothetical protein